MSEHETRASVPVVNLPHLDELERKICYTFRNKAHLARSMIHASRVARDVENASKITIDHNASLEFIGDGVLAAAVRQYVYAQQGNGESPFQHLHDMSDLLEEKAMQAYAARKMQLDEHVFVTLQERQHYRPGDKKSGYQNILGCAYEALIGAVAVDGGMDAALHVLARTFFVHAQPFFEHHSASPTKSGRDRSQRRFGAFKT